MCLLLLLLSLSLSLFLLLLLVLLLLLLLLLLLFFFHILPSKSGPSMRCFCHFDFEICFASQRPTLLQDLNVQKRSKAEVLWVFWLGNVLRATTPCTFWTSQLPKVCLNTWCFYHFDFDMCFAPQHATTACAFSTSELPKALRAWGVFTCWLPNLLRATTPRIFQSFIYPDGSAPAALASFLLDPPEPQNIGKAQYFAAFLPFRAPWSCFFWLFLFSSLTLPTSAFSCPCCRSEVWLLNVHR